MKYSVRFRPEAETEVGAAFNWYEQKRQGLGARFLDELDRALRDVVRAPGKSPLIARRTRRVFLRGFPYFAFYVVDANRVVITGCFHGHRNPNVWSDRVQETAITYGPDGFGVERQPNPLMQTDVGFASTVNQPNR